MLKCATINYFIIGLIIWHKTLNYAASIYLLHNFLCEELEYVLKIINISVQITTKIENHKINTEVIKLNNIKEHFEDR